jgi:hypothetical protein
VTGENRPRIAPPPSVDDVLSSLTEESRIGQVDFNLALVPELPTTPPKVRKVRRPHKPEPEPEPEPEQAVAEPEPEAQPEPEPEPEAQQEPVVEPSAKPDVAREVEDLAAGVMARMQAAEQATLRHLEAMELEASRRYELITAQAELDAELIRLQSRREAHAIVSAARMRAGEIDDLHDDPGDQGHRLSVFTDAISRVADITESTLSGTRLRFPENGS